MTYDFDIIKTFNDTLGENSFENLLNGVNDFDMLRIAIEFLKVATNRLDSDLDNKEIYAEYVKLCTIIEQLEKIRKTYV